MDGTRLVTCVAVALAVAVTATSAQPQALSHPTVGDSRQAVSPPGSHALSIDGDVSLGGFVFRDGYPFLHNDGGPFAYNTALGVNALVSSTPGVPLGASGRYNTAVGAVALYANTEGLDNTAAGFRALRYNTTGRANTAIGTSALRQNTIGIYNTAVGATALKSNSTGVLNTAVGPNAGFYNTTGSNNIWLGSPGLDTEPAASNTIRIGGGTGTGNFQQNRAFISGIRNAIGVTPFNQAVCVDVADQLGPCSSSSARFKEEIAELEAESELVFDLRPVRFRYKEAVAGAGERLVQYGLIAEEVAEVYPQLVTYDDEGRPTTVRYEALTPLLLNELKKQRAEIEQLRALERTVRDQAARLARLEAVAAKREQSAVVARR